MTGVAALLCAVVCFPTMGAPVGSPPPTRDPHAPGFVAATELPDGAVPKADAGGNFIIGPTHTAAPEMAAQAGVPHGMVYTFTMSSSDSKMYPGIARDANTLGVPDPTDPTKLVVSTSHPAPYARQGWGICTAAICAGDGGAIHSGGGRAGPRTLHRTG